MLRSNIQMGDFITQLKILLRSLIIKRDKLAQAFDTSLEFKKAADKYINAIDNGDRWESYVNFNKEVLIEAGLDPNIISYYMMDKERIPREMRAKVVSLQKQYIIDNYQEMNDYYLMLNGEPPIEDTPDDWIEVPANDYKIPSGKGKYVHKLSIEYLNMLESTGILAKMIKQYPNKTYLRYLGRRSVSYYKSRTANNFEILFLESKEVDPVIRQDFIDTYNKARTYYMVGFYNREYSAMFTWYDEFIGLLILIMAIQRLIGNIFKQGLTRDFYDVNLIKYLFKSYSIPYIEELDIKYQRALAKNLNYLLQRKATDQVLYDVSYLLGFYDVNIYKYYLMKSHIIDEETGIPVFAYKQIRENGETKLVPDYEKMYRFHFQQINLKEKDINSALTDERYKVQYDEITWPDPYWVEDYELKQRLYEADFNHMITKYMSLDVTIKIVEMMYEIAHTVRAIIDNQFDFKKVMINIPYISEFDMSLYDAVMLMCALGAKKHGMDGKIPLKGYQIANIYGFNFTDNIHSLQELICNTAERGFVFVGNTQSFYEVQPDGVEDGIYKYRFRKIDANFFPAWDNITEPGYYRLIPSGAEIYRYIDNRYTDVTHLNKEQMDKVIIIPELNRAKPGIPNKYYVIWDDTHQFGYYDGETFTPLSILYASDINLENATVYGFNYNCDIDGLKQSIYDTKDLAYGEIVFGEDTQTFYEVHPGEKVTIPNHFRNQYTSDDTAETITLQKDRFRPIKVRWITDNEQIDTHFMHYKYIPAGIPIYRYYENAYDAIDPISISVEDLNEKIRVVRTLPEIGDPELYYIIWYDGFFGCFNGLSVDEKDVVYVTTIEFNLIDNSLAQYISHMRGVTGRDLGTIYKDIKTLRQFIVKMIAETNDKDVYSQYVKLYHALLVTEDAQELYLDSDGNPQDTYLNLLYNSNKTLYAEYQRLIDIDSGIDNALNTLFAKLSSFGDYKYLANVNRVDSMFDAIMRLVRFFKSYTVDFVSSGILYIFDDRYLQCLKLIDELMITGASVEINDTALPTGRYYKDVMERMLTKLPINEHQQFKDWMTTIAVVWYADKYIMKLRDDYKMKGTMILDDTIRLYDDLQLSAKNLPVKSRLKLSDSLDKMPNDSTIDIWDYSHTISPRNNRRPLLTDSLVITTSIQ